jgi:hypothetical protein
MLNTFSDGNWMLLCNQEPVTRRLNLLSHFLRISLLQQLNKVRNNFNLEALDQLAPHGKYAQEKDVRRIAASLRVLNHCRGQ